MSAIEPESRALRAPPRSDSERVARTSELLALAFGACGLTVFAVTLVARAGFAWPLEWMEGASVQHALRLLHGQALYAAPSVEFIPYLYPPLSYVPMAVALALFGSALPAARVASIACTLVSLALIGRCTARAAGAGAGALAAGLFAIGFGYAGAFLDLARVDACFVMLLLAGAERLQAQRPRAALVWFALSAFSKQHGVLLLLAASAALLVQAPRRNARAVVAVWACVVAVFIALQVATGGWFGRYVVALPESQPLSWPLLLSFVPIDLFVYLPVLAGTAAYDMYKRSSARALEPADAVLLAAIVAGALGRAHAGGHDNVRLPAFALLCIAGVAPLMRGARSMHSVPRMRVLSWAALALQFAVLWQAPSFHAPPSTSAAQFSALRAALDRCAGGGSTAALDYAGFGSQPLLNTMALSDLRMSGDGELAREGTDALLRGVRSSQAPRALAVGEHFSALDHVLAAHYRECARVPAPELASGYRPGFRDATGLWQVVYVPADQHAAVPR